MAALVLSARLGKIALESAMHCRACEMMMHTEHQYVDIALSMVMEARDIYKRLSDMVDGELILQQNIDQSYAIVKLIEDDWRHVSKKCSLCECATHSYA